MARRKKGFLDDGSDSDASNESGSDGGYDSQEDGDSRAERRLFEHRRKRPRMGNGKAAAWEGVFGEEEDGPRRPRGGPRARGGGTASERADWTKYVPWSKTHADFARAPTFVSKSDTPTQAPVEQSGPAEPSGTPSDDSDDSDDSSSSEGSPSRAPSPRRAEDEEEDVPHAGLGGRPGIGGRAGIGGMGFNAASAFTSAGAGAPAAQPRPNEEPPAEKSAFGRRAAVAIQQMQGGGARSNFQSSRSTTPGTVNQTELTRAEKAHFTKVAGGFGAQLLAKQGWAPGKGLGLNEDGRAVPVAVGTVMRGEGIRSGIRTEDSKREARRKGELVEEEPKAPKRGGRKGPQRPPGASREGWQKHKKVKVKVTHKSYEELLAEEGADTTRPGVGLVIDARGGEMKTVESIADLSLSGWTPTADVTQLPELRHNLRLVLDVTRGDVGNLVREGKAVNERRRWSTRDEQRSRQRAEESSKGNY